MMRWLRPLWLVAALVGLSWAGWRAWAHTAQAGAGGVGWSGVDLAIAIGCLLVHTALAALAWAVLARGWLPAVALRAHAHDFFVAAPGKYLPGGVWMAVSRIAALASRGASTATATALVVIEQVLALASLALLAMLATCAGGRALDLSPGSSRALHLGLAAALALLVAASMWRLRRSDALRTLAVAQAPGVVLRAFALTVASHVPFVLGYVFLILPEAARNDATTMSASSAVLAGTLAGFLTPFAPGGIGVREGLIAALAGTGGRLAEVTVGVLAARAILVAIEFLAFAACTVGSWRARPTR